MPRLELEGGVPLQEAVREPVPLGACIEGRR
jgi:hypothetical protein